MRFFKSRCFLESNHLLRYSFFRKNDYLTALLDYLSYLGIG